MQGPWGAASPGEEQGVHAESKIRIEIWLAIRLVEQFFKVGQCKLHVNYVLACSELSGHLPKMLEKWPVANCYF